MFWLGAGVVVLLVIAAVVLLYAYGVAKATDESFLNVLGGIFSQLRNGEFF